ncbi:DEAD/DEAH box helicase [Chakrabartyella piscis]|uniref:DEAD/DEAH box helicase n=1 Tax=Chakrabartyella piscis TaxID=2918914 RepID=UPI002958DABA|nr:SNF2-related protein [Chakrabartyella piscis]
MLQSTFEAYYMARKLENISRDIPFLPVFSSSDIKVYPFQIAAAHFALRSPYQKGVVLCDESGMGKSHEAMLVICQKWYEGKKRILLCIPNIDLLTQWIDVIEKHYSIPFVVVCNQAQWDTACDEVGANGFVQQGLIISTYDFVAEMHEFANEVAWDMMVFEEATALVGVYKPENKIAKILKQVSNDAFRLLLTGTPIEKNIMDLYGLLYFIDETILEDEQSFLNRYLRKPENYPELANRVSKYCFRTLRSQAKSYAKITKRVPITLEYTLTEQEKQLYNVVFSYCQKESKLAFPQMKAYDLTLRLLGILGSSTAALKKSFENIRERMGNAPYDTEIDTIIDMASKIQVDAKATALLGALDRLFALAKKTKGEQKVLIFTESVETQKYLYSLLEKQYKTEMYNGNSDYSAITKFKNTAEILIATDRGARGFNLEECSVVIQYDLLYNTLKMEQRIDRLHRLGQQNDVVVVSFINSQNFADVRKLELINKRTLVADGVLGLSDMVIGGFTKDLSVKIDETAKCSRTKKEIESEYQKILLTHEKENKETVLLAEEKLFTTFTRELANKVHITPNYIVEQSGYIQDDLWELAKYYFKNYNENNEDCVFVMDEQDRTITATEYKELPVLFYYWNGTQNRKYISKKQYGMAKDFKPTQNRISLTSIIGQGILNEISCANEGEIIVKQDVIPCTIGLYDVRVKNKHSVIKSIPVLVGRNKLGKILSNKQCEEILHLEVLRYVENGKRSPAWLKAAAQKHDLDICVETESLLQMEKANLSEAQKEEIARMEMKVSEDKVELTHMLGDLKKEVERLEKALQEDSLNRMEVLQVTKEKNGKILELKKKQEVQFFEEMQMDVALEEQIKEFLQNEELGVDVVRQFVVEVNTE